MFFFKEISGLLTEGVELNLTVARSGDKLVVSVLPKVKDVKDEAAKRIIPVVVSGSPDELDREFSAAISSPVQSATGLLTNMKEFEKSTEAAAKNSKSVKAEQDKAKKLADDNKKKLDKLTKKADEFEKDKKYKNAVACLKQALEFSANKSSLESKIQKLEALAGQNSLFADEEEETVQDNYLVEDGSQNEPDDVPFEDDQEEDNTNEEEE